jgi:tRNA(fMet)-specific endonuclease VapC
MSKYLLDTDTLIDFFSGREPARTRLLELITEGNDVATCAITEAEFFAGLSPQQRKQSADFFEALTFWPISAEAARNAGTIRYDLARQGKAVPITDCLIAAVAIEQAAIILTSNTSDYPKDDVTTLSLREDPRQ